MEEFLQMDGWMDLSVSMLKIKQRLSFASAHPLALRHHEFSHAAVSFYTASQKKILCDIL